MQFTDVGALHAREHGITDLASCKAYCARCANCNYVSFSIGVHGAVKDHDDCSWYNVCNLADLTKTGAEYVSTEVKKAPQPQPPPPPATVVVSGVRVYDPIQQLPSPRYANCIANGVQTITAEDNAARVPQGVDEEWFAVEKEHMLAAKCAEGGHHRGDTGGVDKFPSYFWTTMSQNVYEYSTPHPLGFFLTRGYCSDLNHKVYCYLHC